MGEREPGKKRSERCTAREEMVGSKIPKVVGKIRNREKVIKISHFVIFCNRSGTKRPVSVREGGESGRFAK